MCHQISSGVSYSLVMAKNGRAKTIKWIIVSTHWSFPGGARGKDPPANAGNALGLGDPLEEEMATYSSIPASRIPWTEKPGRLQFMAGFSVHGITKSRTGLNVWAPSLQTLTKCFLLLSVLSLPLAGMRQTSKDLFPEPRMGSLMSRRRTIIGYPQWRVVGEGLVPWTQYLQWWWETGSRWCLGGWRATVRACAFQTQLQGDRRSGSATHHPWW